MTPNPFIAYVGGLVIGIVIAMLFFSILVYSTLKVLHKI